MEKEPSYYQKFSVSLLAYVVLKAVTTAFGRASSGLGQASVLQYWTPALLFWFVLSSLLYSDLRRGGRAAPWIRSVTKSGLLAFGFLIALPAQIVGVFRELGQHYLRCDEAALAAMVGVRDSTKLFFISQKGFDPDNSKILERVQIL